MRLCPDATKSFAPAFPLPACAGLRSSLVRGRWRSALAPRHLNCYLRSFLSGPLQAMPLDSSTVRHIARLARIAMSDADLELAAGEMAQVLTLADQLGAAQIEGVTPLAHPHDQNLSWRPDAVSEPDRAEAFLALAPEARGGLYLVPTVLE